jgi:hypothetical protein
MSKTKAQSVRDAEAKHRARGEREIRVWVPATDEAIEKVRSLARRLCRKNMRETAQETGRKNDA